MVNIQIPANSVYTDVNKALFYLLSKGISQENKEIKRLKRLEKSLYNQVKTDSRSIKKRNLGEMKITLARKIRTSKSRIQSVKRELRDAEASFKHSQTAAASLKNEIKARKHDSEKLEKKLETVLKILQKKGVKSQERSMREHRKSRTLITKFRAKQRKFRIGINEAQKKFERNTISEIKRFEGKRRSAYLRYRSSMSNKNKTILQLEQQKLKIKKSAAKAIQDKVDSLKRKKAEFESHLEKKESISRRLENLVRRREAAQGDLDSQTQKLRGLRDSLKKWGKSWTVISRKVRADNKKQRLHEVNKLHRGAQLRHINTLHRECTKKLSALRKERSGQLKKIEKLNLLRKKVTAQLDNDTLDLNNALSSLAEIEKTLVRQERVDDTNEKLLLVELHAKESELLSGNAKLKKVEGMLRKVKDVSGQWPEVVHGFYAEKANVKLRLASVQKELTKRKSLLDSLKKSSMSFHHEFALKKTRAESIRDEITKERRVHLNRLSNIDHSLSKLRKSLTGIKKSTDKESEKRADFKVKKTKLKLLINELSTLITRRKNEYEHDATLKKMVSNKLVSLDKQRVTASKRIDLNTKKLLKYDNGAELQERLLKQLSAESTLIEKLTAKIQKETSLVKAFRSSRKIALEKSLETYLRRESGTYKREALNKINALNRAIQSERTKGVKAYKQWQKKRTELFQKLEKEKSSVSKLRRQAEQKDRASIKSIESEIKAVRKKMDEESQGLHGTLLNIENELKKKKTEFAKERRKLRTLTSISRSEKLNMSKSATAARKSISSLKQRIGNLQELIQHSFERQASISKKMKTMDQSLRQLNAAVRAKVKLINQKRKLRQEMHHLHLILNNQVPKGIVKTRIIRKIKKVHVRDISGMKPALKAIDSLLGKLPKKDLDKFAASSKFKLYKNVMNRYGVR
jgi:hypothetical protein